MAVASFAEYITLIGRADDRLIKHGVTDPETRIHILASIYYGAEWSRDFQVEHSSVRNESFGQFVGRPFSELANPRSTIGPGLFRQLQAAQDVQGVDMGHMLIGLDARMRAVSREQNFPGLQTSGLEIVTWVGDLGAAAARCAFDEAGGRADVETYFRGTDYGASSNLEGDIAAYLVGSNGAISLGQPTFPGGKVASALAAYFQSPTAWRNRKARFQQLASGGTTTSRGIFARKIRSFAQVYYHTRIAKDHYSEFLQLAKGEIYLVHSPERIADRFVGWVEGSSRTPAHRAPKPSGRIITPRLPAYGLRFLLDDMQSLSPPLKSARSQTVAQAARQAAQRAAQYTQQAMRQAAEEAARRQAQQAQRIAQHGIRQATQQAAQQAARQAAQQTQQAQQEAARQAAQHAARQAAEQAQYAAHESTRQAAQQAAQRVAHEAVRQMTQAAQQVAQRAGRVAESQRVAQEAARQAAQRTQRVTQETALAATRQAQHEAIQRVWQRVPKYTAIIGPPIFVNR
jgi:hypothetical protein